MSLITRGSIIEALRPGIHEWAGLGYNQNEDYFSQLFDVLSSNMNYERDVFLYPFEAGSVKPEGTGANYGTMGQGFAYNYLHVPYALAGAMTHEMQMDNQYMKVAEQIIKGITRGMKETKETVAANVFNLGFSNTVTYADGLELFSTANLLAGGGTFSNKLSTDADLSEASLEQAVLGVQGFTDHRSNKVKINPVCLWVPKEQQFEAARLLESELRVSTADNDINVLKSGRYLPGGYKVNKYFSDTDA